MKIISNRTIHKLNTYILEVKHMGRYDTSKIKRKYLNQIDMTDFVIKKVTESIQREENSLHLYRTN